MPVFSQPPTTSRHECQRSPLLHHPATLPRKIELPAVSRSSAAPLEEYSASFSPSMSPQAARPGPCSTWRPGRRRAFTRREPAATGSTRWRSIRATTGTATPSSAGAGGATTTRGCSSRSARSGGFSAGSSRSRRSTRPRRTERAGRVSASWPTTPPIRSARPVFWRRAAAAAVLQRMTFDLVLCAHLLVHLCAAFRLCLAPVAACAVSFRARERGARCASTRCAALGGKPYAELDRGCGGSLRVAGHRERGRAGELRVFRRQQHDAPVFKK